MLCAVPSTHRPPLLSKLPQKTDSTELSENILGQQPEYSGCNDCQPTKVCQEPPACLLGELARMTLIPIRLTGKADLAHEQAPYVLGRGNHE